MKDSRILTDASAIIALANIGELDILKNIFPKIHITTTIQKELLVEDYPETSKIKKALEKWIKIIKVDEENLEKYKKYGLGRGEASLIEVSRKNDKLILDDPVARKVAEVEGLEFTGLIGLLAEAGKKGLISKEKGEEILEKLSNSKFRMSLELYNWAKNKLKNNNY